MDDQRPKTRAECAGGQRPCPWVSCRYHLYLDVNPQTGHVKIRHPDVEPHEMLVSCALDVADLVAAGEVLTLAQLGDLVGVTRQRVQQVTWACADDFELVRGVA